MPERTQLDEASRKFDGIISPLKALSAETGRLAIWNDADDNQDLLPEDPREQVLGRVARHYGRLSRARASLTHNGTDEAAGPGARCRPVGRPRRNAT